MGSKDCASEGWGDEPVEFSAHQNLDCEIQIWAYRYIHVCYTQYVYCHKRLYPPCTYKAENMKWMWPLALYWVHVISGLHFRHVSHYKGGNP